MTGEEVCNHLVLLRHESITSTDGAVYVCQDCGKILTFKDE